jgi:predicted phosphoadenosine phosphosulfate sulfurtransferase
MSTLKRYQKPNVYDAACERVRYAFDNFERVYVSFSGGKDSSVMLHLVAAEAIKRGRKIGVLFIDLEAQYALTISHIREMVDLYRDHIELHWVCLLGARIRGGLDAREAGGCGRRSFVLSILSRTHGV